MTHTIGHILLVDDSRLGRLLLTKGLRQAGYHITEAISGVDALASIGEHHYDAVFIELDAS